MTSHVRQKYIVHRWKVLPTFSISKGRCINWRLSFTRQGCFPKLCSSLLLVTGKSCLHSWNKGVHAKTHISGSVSTFTWNKNLFWIQWKWVLGVGVETKLLKVNLIIVYRICWIISMCCNRFFYIWIFYTCTLWGSASFPVQCPEMNLSLSALDAKSNCKWRLWIPFSTLSSIFKNMHDKPSNNNILTYKTL